MDRRKFLIKTGQLSAALTAPKTSLVPPAVGEPSPSVKGSHTLANNFVAWRLDWENGKLLSTSYLNKMTNSFSPITSAEELVLTFSAADTRIEIPWWRFQFGPDDTAVAVSDEQGLKSGFHQPDFSDEHWAVTENLLRKRLSGPKPKYQDEIRYDGYGWFRKWIALPESGRGQEVHLVLGGWDYQDWNEYWVYLNGIEVGHRTSQGIWRAPGDFKIATGDSTYASLRFGEGTRNLLAVRTRGFDKSSGGVSEGLLKHYVFEPFWVDQFVTCGAPYLVVSDFEVQSVRKSGARAEFQLKSRATEVECTLRYELDGPTRRKWAEIRNAGPKDLLLLDAQLDDFRVAGSISPGGPGQPVFISDSAFAAIEHPAGLNQGDGLNVRLTHFPGKTLRPGETFRTYTAIVSVSKPGKTLEHFTDYIQRRSPRRDQLLSLYTPYGINNPSGACPALNDLETLNILDVVEKWQAKGMKFDYFTLDQGWVDPAGDLTGFAPQCYPEGPGKIVQRVKALGMKFGLWFSISGAPWSCPENPAVKPSFVPPPGDPDLGLKPVEVYDTGYGMMHGRLCIASEPYFSMLRDAILHHIEHNNLKLFKIDMGTYYCNSMEHGHLPGKYSVEAMYNHLLELSAVARAKDPEVYVMWYWGVRSPFFALHGGSVFESGLFMEGSGTSWTPALYYRDAVTVNLDQGTQFAETIPAANKDSLGVWLADIRWGNFMGAERWREALVMDLGRGNLIFPQLWGDIRLLDDRDVEFLAAMNSLVQQNARLFAHRRNILGNPCMCEVYGYANAKGARGFLFINNPHFAPRPAEILLGPEAGLDAAAGTPVEIISHFPERKTISSDSGAGTGFKIGDRVKVMLRPFEVLMLEVGADRAASRALPPRTSAESGFENAGIRLKPTPLANADSLEAQFNRAEKLEQKGFKKKVLAWTADLPNFADVPHILAIPTVLRQSRMEWRYAPTVVEIVQVVARIGGKRISMIPVPDARQYGNTQAAGCSWIVYKLRLGREHSGQKLEFGVTAYLPDGVEALTEAWLVQQWWDEPSSPQGDGFYADDPA
jgi:hypothetical protein